MTSSAPFPGEPTLQELAHPSHGIFIKLEDGHVRGMVPSFYRDHADAANLVVQVNGEPLLSPDNAKGSPFVVAQVPIERRWAVLPNGEVMGELEFRKHYIMWYDEYFRELGRENPDLQNVDGGKPDYDIPDPKRFVAVQVDETNPRKFVPANYDPHGTAGARSRQFFTSDGEEVDEDRLKVLCNAYADPKLRMRLSTDEVAEVERSLGLTRNSGGDEIATKLELLNSMLASGDLTTEQHSNQVALLTGAPAPAPEPVEPGEPATDLPAEPDLVEKAGVTEANPGAPQTYTASTRCGKEFTKGTRQGAGAAVRMHARNCPACKEAGD